MVTASKAQRNLAKPDSRDLLAWYDRHRRVLPWRALPGQLADPYAVWLSEIMLQQTTVKAVGPYFNKFLALWPDVKALADAPVEDVMRAWAGLGYYSRARNLHACAKAVVERHGGQFPADEKALLGLPGVGPYTAAAIAAIAFDLPATVVDGNVERVIARLYCLEEPLPAAKSAIRQLAAALTPQRRPGDFAQGMMDLGASICTPKSPACALCPYSSDCAGRAGGAPQSYPRKAPKAERPHRQGAAFYARRADGHVLVRTRPPKGLLGGMVEIPGSEWGVGYDPARVIAVAPFWTDTGTVWHSTGTAIDHTFTHFSLTLAVYISEVAPATKAPEGMRWVHESKLKNEAFPSVMQKVVAVASDPKIWQNKAEPLALRARKHKNRP